jgi:hypothetical protein
MKMSVAHEIAKAQENQSREQLKDSPVSEDFSAVGVHPLDELLDRSHGQAPMEGGRWESGAGLPPTTNVAQQYNATGRRIRGDFQKRRMASGAYKFRELPKFIGESFRREPESSVALTGAVAKEGEI